MEFLCYFNLFEQQFYDIQRFQQNNIWQPWREINTDKLLGKISNFN